MRIRSGTGGSNGDGQGLPHGRRFERPQGRQGRRGCSGTAADAAGGRGGSGGAAAAGVDLALEGRRENGRVAQAVGQASARALSGRPKPSAGEAAAAAAAAAGSAMRVKPWPTRCVRRGGRGL